MPEYSFGTLGIKISPLAGIQGGAAPFNVNLGPPSYLVKYYRDRKQKLKTQLNTVKFSLSVQKFLR